MPKRAAADAFHDALLEDDPVQLYEDAPCGYLSTTPGGRIVKVNTTFQRWTGYQADALLGRPLVELLTPGGRIYHETHYAPMLRMQGRVREIAVDLVRSDGQRLPVLLNASVALDDDGEPRVIRVAVFDATERRNYERELVRAKEQAQQSEERARLLAQTLQQTLIPPGLLTIPGLALAADYRPSGDGSQVGGDFYDVLPLDRGRWCLLLGDVSGKGVHAAVVTTLCRYTARALAFGADHVSDVLAEVNRTLCRHDTERFVTMTIAILTPAEDGWRVQLGVAGHPPPLLVEPPSTVTPLHAPGALVGIFPHAEFGERELLLRPGSSMLFYSDGITEARDGQSIYGDERLAVTAARLGPVPDVLVDGLVEDVRAFQGLLASDDIAVLAVGVV